MADSDSGHSDEETVNHVYSFPTPFEWNIRDPITLHELRMRAFAAMVLEKPRWWEKVLDEALVDKGRQEMQEFDRLAVARAQKQVKRRWPKDGDSDDPDDHSEDEDEEDSAIQQWLCDLVTDAQFEWTFAFLKHAAGQRDETTGCQVTTIPCGGLESVPDEEKDWHPGSDGQVLDLVHPSLYCLCIDRTQVVRPAEEIARFGDPLTVYNMAMCREERADIDHDIGDYYISLDFQWLSTDFQVSESGDVRRLGYMNNLHPIKHRALCDTITSVLQRFVPLFEKSLSDVLSPTPPLAINVNPYLWYSHLPLEVRYDSESEKRKPLIPDPTPFAPPSAEGRIELNLKGRVLQPHYRGGSWHVEGMANEKIVATGLYYYACDNITESRLAFRAQVGTDSESINMLYVNGDRRAWKTTYGMGSEEPLNQNLGSIVAAEGKCVVFPNIYQHRVQPFELADKTKPGHRKILCFFLVQPFVTIASTSRVPPQQREWILDEMERAPPLQRLPRELFDMVVDYALASTSTRKQAENDREELMEERKNFVVTHNEEVFEVPFNSCEHETYSYAVFTDQSGRGERRWDTPPQSLAHKQCRG
ncbi:hypothetical protein BD309DRAFT_1082863 [Dichomitus squalens]|uniref:Uncharacterized protein n=1 Tax=Dichomitus squalens TaxID=114155 RepID=A0A4Q9NKD4_9APHY|nr:hypothetical protein BD309DRAFT_1082863 [Dichomitus squalens]TBU57012.1 hypothetical protein BD310DRAFT_1040077 [Dichomitus squalens]